MRTVRTLIVATVIASLPAMLLAGFGPRRQAASSPDAVESVPPRLDGAAAASRSARTPEPEYEWRIRRIDAKARRMMGASWRRGCPVPLSRLRVLTVTAWKSNGTARPVQIVVHRQFAPRLARVFREVFEARFPVNTVYGHWCRASVGAPGSWSEHAYGRAVDINAGVNPYVRAGRVVPPTARPYANRKRRMPGMIRRRSSVVRAFAEIGWQWGGEWKSAKDYMHFSATGQ